MTEVQLAEEKFRVYDETSRRAAVVHDHYQRMRSAQSYAFVEEMEKRWLHLSTAKMNIRSCFDLLKAYVDTSDPDTELPNMIHMLQTAEAIRAGGEPEWMILVGLIHDLGKAMCLIGPYTPEERKALGQLGTAEGPQFALGGDTWVVGAPLPDCCVLPQYNALNPDKDHPLYSKSPLGIYEKGCGMMNLKFAFGHDEYIYHVVKKHQELLPNSERIPPEGLAILRLHSCYPWHSGGAYREFMSSDGSDEALLNAVKRFQKYDLYTKRDLPPSVDELWPYYQGLIDKFLPGDLHF
jgi:inositol oxygenase